MEFTNGAKIVGYDSKTSKLRVQCACGVVSRISRSQVRPGHMCRECWMGRNETDEEIHALVEEQRKTLEERPLSLQERPIAEEQTIGLGSLRRGVRTDRRHNGRPML